MLMMMARRRRVAWVLVALTLRLSILAHSEPQGSQDGAQVLGDDPGQCRFVRPRQGECVKPRRCQDCLVMRGCMINQLGVCESMRLAGYDAAMDYTVAIEKGLSGPEFRNAASNDTQLYQFPAFNVTYCAATDVVCQRCRTEIFPKSPPDSRFCVGEFGCVCIAACESASWTEIATGGECEPPPPVVTERKEKKPRNDAKDGKDRTQTDFGWKAVLTQAVAPVLTGILATIALWKYFQARHQLKAIKQFEMRDDDVRSSSRTDRSSSQSHSDDSRRFDDAGGAVPRFVGGAEDKSPSQHYRRLGPDSTTAEMDRTVCAIPVVLVSSGKGTPDTGGVLEAIELRMVQPSAPGFDDDDADERNLRVAACDSASA